MKQLLLLTLLTAPLISYAADVPKSSTDRSAKEDAAFKQDQLIEKIITRIERKAALKTLEPKSIDPKRIMEEELNDKIELTALTLAALFITMNKALIGSQPSQVRR